MERAKWRARFEIWKFRDPTGEIAEKAKKGAKLADLAKAYPQAFQETVISEGNCLLNEGIDYLWDIVIGAEGAPTLWDEANTRLGVGNSNTAADPADTDLKGASKDYHAMDATYPQRSGEQVEWRASFADGHAEFAWEEAVVDNGAVSGKTLNRKVESKGTKGAGSLWTARMLITIT